MDHVSYATYREASLNAQVAGASPVQLALVLMNALLDEMVRVRAHIEHRRYEAKGASIGKCIDMFAALTSALDFELGGGLVQRLGELYEYCCARLNHAGCVLDPGMVDEVIGLVTTLRDAWQQVEDRSR